MFSRWLFILFLFFFGGGLALNSECSCFFIPNARFTDRPPYPASRWLSKQTHFLFQPSVCLLSLWAPDIPCNVCCLVAALSPALFQPPFLSFMWLSCGCSLGSAAVFTFQQKLPGQHLIPLSFILMTCAFGSSGWALSCTPSFDSGLYQSFHRNILQEPQIQHS